MNKQPENVKTTVSIPQKNDSIFRRAAFNDNLTLGELFLKYQKAYLEQLEFEKEKKAKNKELQQTGKAQCPHCEQWVYKK